MGDLESSNKMPTGVTKIDKIFMHCDITSRVPPDLCRYLSLLLDTQDLRHDEAAVVDCLVRINADLTAQATQNIQTQGGSRPGVSEDSRATRRRSTMASSPVLNEDVAIHLPVLGSIRATGSPKARRILGLEVSPQIKSYGAPNKPLSDFRREETSISSLSTRFVRLTPKSTQSPEFPQRRNSMRSNLERANSLSDAKNLVATVVGGEKPRNTSGVKPNRAEKYLRGVLDIFRGPPAISKTAGLRTTREQRRSAPAGRKLAQFSSRHPPRIYRPAPSNSVHQPYGYHEPFGANKARLPSGKSLPMLHSAFSWESGLQHSRSAGTLGVIEKTPACSAEVQIKEVLLEYVYGKIRTSRGDRLGYSDNEEKGGGESQWLTSLIICLNHISCDTRCKVGISICLFFSWQDLLKLNPTL